MHCISTEFTPRKHGGEKGVPFRIQIDTFKQNESGEYVEHLHSASCQIKVFKVTLIPMSLWGVLFGAKWSKSKFVELESLHVSVCSRREQTGSKRPTERRWKKGVHRRRRNTSPPMILLYFQRQVYSVCVCVTFQCELVCPHTSWLLNMCKFIQSVQYFTEVSCDCCSQKCSLLLGLFFSKYEMQFAEFAIAQNCSARSFAVMFVGK